MKIKEFISSILIIGLAGCASAPSPEMLKLAEARKGQVQQMTVSLDGKDFSQGCGYAHPNESVACSQSLLMRKLQDKAYEHCVHYEIGQVSWQGYPGLYPRSTSATATVTCKG